MKSWLLYFLAVLIGVSLLPIAASRSFAAKKIPTIRVEIDGEVTEMDIEEYTLRVLLAEGRACANAETKKSLAIAARSCAVYFSYYGCKHKDFDVCSNGSCCFPLGKTDDIDKEFLQECKTAAKETFGLTLSTRDSFAAMALFTLCSGSGTTDCEEFPYLTAVSEETRCDLHITEKTVDLKTIDDALTEKSFKNDSVLVYDQFKKCAFGVFNGKLINGKDISALLCLPSDEFTLQTNEQGVIAKSYGSGHGFGLNLCGAEKMADSGKGFEEILEFYFPNLIMNKIYSE